MTAFNPFGGKSALVPRGITKSRVFKEGSKWVATQDGYSFMMTNS